MLVRPLREILRRLFNNIDQLIDAPLEELMEVDDVVQL